MEYTENVNDAARKLDIWVATIYYSPQNEWHHWHPRAASGLPRPRVANTGTEQGPEGMGEVAGLWLDFPVSRKTMVPKVKLLCGREASTQWFECWLSPEP